MLPSVDARCRLHRVVQGLLQEQVPLTRWEDLLDAFAASPPDEPDIGAVIEAVRSALRPVLPGQDRRQGLIGLTPEFERAVARGVQQRDGKRFLALPPEDWRRLMDSLRRGLPEPTGLDAVLLVREPGLRRFVRRLVEPEFPGLIVLGADERIEPASTIEDWIGFPAPVTAESR